MEKSSFFNAELVGEEYDRVYLAEDFARYFSSFVGNGVFPNPSSNLQVLSNNNMTITVRVGKGFINGYYYENTTNLIKDITLADGVLNRIDLVVLRLNLANREIKCYVKQGIFASRPVAPTLEKSSDLYELGLASIYIKAGATSITQSDITDLRLNSSYCGLVSSVVNSVDVTTLYNQYATQFKEDIVKFGLDFNTWFNNIKGKLEDDPATSLQEQVTKLDLRTASEEYSIKNYISNSKMLNDLSNRSPIAQVKLNLTDEYYRNGRVLNATVSGYNNNLAVNSYYPLVFLSEDIYNFQYPENFIVSVWVRLNNSFSLTGTGSVNLALQEHKNGNSIIGKNVSLDLTNKEEWQRLAFKVNKNDMAGVTKFRVAIMNANIGTIQDTITISGQMDIALPCIYAIEDLIKCENEIGELKHLVTENIIGEGKDLTTNPNYEVLDSQYTIVNGVCYISNFRIKCNTPINGPYVAGEGLPLPDIPVSTMYMTLNNWGADNLILGARIDTEGKIVVKGGVSGQTYVGSISYPVKVE